MGVVLSGGQASGGHNVIAGTRPSLANRSIHPFHHVNRRIDLYIISGIYDYVKGVSPDSVLIGFADGPKGVFTGCYFEVVRTFPCVGERLHPSADGR